MDDRVWSRWLRMKGTSKKESNRGKSRFIPSLQHLECRLAPTADIAYLFSSDDASGSLNGVPFSHASIQFSIPADTSNVNETMFGAGAPAIGNLTGTVDVSGFSTSTISLPLYVFNRHLNQDVGFGYDTSTKAEVLNLVSEGVGLDHYDLKTPFGPAVSSYVSYVPNFVIPTSNGNLSFDVTPAVTFQAMDIAPPTLAISPNGTSTNASELTFTFTFSENVADFDASDVTVTNGAKGTFTALNGSTYSLVVTPNSDGTVTASVAANAARDASGNASGAASASVTSERVAPTVDSIVRAVPAATATNANSVTFTVTFSEPVTGVDATDFAVATTATVTSTGVAQVSGSGAVYSVTVGGLVGNGTLGLNLVDDNSIHDLSGKRLSSHSANFKPFVSYATLASLSVPAADFNGDGNLDLAFGESGIGIGIGILYGNGNGTFQPLQTSLSPVANGSVFSADFDGDTRADLLTYSTSSSIAIRLGNGNGTFQPAATYQTDNNSTTFWAGDLNGDGRPDIVTGPSHSLSTTMSVFLNNGDGTFKPRVTYANGVSGNVSIADVDNDGDNDVVIRNDINVSVFLNNGDGSLMPRMSFSGIYLLGQLGDLDGDGRLDFVAATSGGFSQHLGNGDGTFRPRTSIASASASRSIALADLNGDGHLDVVLGKSTARVGVFMGNGDGTFAAEQTFTTNAAFAISGQLTVADFNGDGRQDLAPQTLSPKAVSILLNAGGSTVGQTYVIDQSAPTASITAQPPAVSLSATATFSFTGSDPVAGSVSSGVSRFEFQIDGGAWTTTTSPTNLSGLGHGQHVFAVRSVDNAGNVGSPASVTWMVDLTVPPRVVSISYQSPGDSYTTASNVVAVVTFNEPVTGVDPSDFVVAVYAGALTVGGIAVAGSGTTYFVTLSAITGEGALHLNLIDDDSIVGTFNDLALVDANDSDGTFFGALARFHFDHTAPTVSMTAQPAALTTSPTASFSFSGSDPISGDVSAGVDRLEYSVDGGAFVSVNGASGTANLSGLITGMHTFQVRAVDNVGNASVLASYSWTVDVAKPTVISIVRGTPAATVTNASSVTYTVTFSESVTGVDAGDFIVPTTGAVLTTGISQVSGSGGVYSVTIGGISGNGTVGLTLVRNNTIGDLAGNLFDPPQVFFQGSRSYASGLASETAVTADFDSDGALDLVMADEGRYGIFSGNGNGTFQPVQTISSSVPNHVAYVGDFNGDGVADLASFADGGTAFALRIGNGDGSFKATATFAMLGALNAMAIADFDADGKLDVVGASSSRMSVLIGNGNGTFKPLVTYSNGTTSQALIGDVNNDHVVDVLFRSSGSIGIFVGNGDGSFQPRTNFTASTLTAQLADVNGDGSLDLVGTTSSGVSFYLGNGNGTFQSPTSVASANSPNAVQVADLNNDGRVDVILGKTNASRVGVLLGNGNGTFVAEQTFSTRDNVTNSVQMNAVDLDGDGRLDLIVQGYTAKTVSVLLGNGVNNVVGPTYAIDQAGPTVSFTQQPPSESLSAAATFAFDASDAVVGGVSSGVNRFEYQIDGGGFVAAASPVSFAGLADGPHAFVLRTFDNVGNMTESTVNWTIDTTAPLRVIAIDRTTPAGPLTNSTSVVYTVTFNDSVSGLDSGDFALVRTGSVMTGAPSFVALSGHTYSVTVSAITGDGTLRLDLVDDDSIVSNATGLPLGSAADGSTPGAVYSIDHTAPTTTILAMPPAATASHSATFDFAAIDPIVGDVSSGVGHFEYRLDMIGGFVAAAASLTLNGLGVGGHVFEVRAIDALGNVGVAATYTWAVAPVVQSIVRNGAEVTNATNLAFTVTFDAPIVGIDETDFALAKTGTIDGTVAQVAGSGTSYVVTVSGITGDGVLGLNLVDNDTILGASGAAPLGGPGSGNFVGAVYAVDHTSPILTVTGMPPPATNSDVTSIFRYTSEDPVVFGVSSGVNRVEFSYDGAAYVTAPAPFAFQVFPSEGAHNVLIRAVDEVGNAGTPFNYSWTVDTAAPSLVSIARSNPAEALTGASIVTYVVTFDEHVTGVDSTDFEVSASAGLAVSVGAVTPVGLTAYAVQLTGIAGSGQLAIRIKGDGSIQDLAGNVLAVPELIVGEAISTGDVAAGVTSGDFNGDGLADIAVLTNGPIRVNVLLGNGNGTFAPGATLTGSTVGFDVATADLNGDGKLDLVFAARGGGAMSTTARIYVALGNGDGTFTAPTLYLSGTPAAVSITLADVNGDNRPDILLARNASNTGLLLNNGNGTFALQQSISVGIVVVSIAVGDVNDDGKADLVTASDAGSSISLALGNGDGTFSARQVLDGGVNGTAIALADLDGDGSLDIVAASQGAISSLRGNGNGTFKPRLTYAALNVTSLVIADVSGDGLLDVAYVRNAGVGVLNGNGDGSFISSGFTDRETGDIAVADFDGDGILDVVVSSAETYETVLLYFNQNFGPSYSIDQAKPAAAITAQPPTLTPSASASFSFSALDPVVNGVSSGVNRLEYSLDGGAFVAGTSASFSGLGEGVHEFRVRAVDGVGNVGAVASYSWTIDLTAPRLVSIVRAAPKGSPTSASSVTYAVTFDEPVVGVDEADFEVVGSGSAVSSSLQVSGSGATYLVVVGGVAGSGALRLDLVDDDRSIADVAGNPLANRSSPGAFEASQTFAATPGASAVTAADLDGDGALDVIETNSGANVVSVMLGAGGGLGSPQTFAVGAFPVAVVVADVDGDGTPDLVVVDRSGAGVSLLLGNGDGSFQSQQTFGTGARPTAAALADLDGDGNVDVVAVNAFSNNAAVLLGNGDGTFQPLRTFGTGGLPTAVAIGDVSGDGEHDLVVVNQASRSISVLRGDGAGHFGPQATFAIGASPSSLSLADVDGDGTLDVVVANSGEGSIGVLLNLGDGTFEPQATYGVGSLPRSLAVADVSGDGVLDVVVVSGGDVGVLHGSGDGTFAPQTTFAVGASATSLSLGDVNGDGAIDVLIASDSDVGHVLFGTPAGSVVGDTYVIDPSAPLDPLDVPRPSVTNIGAAQVLDVVPFVGPTSGGTTVVLSGVNFLGVTAVHFGGAAALSYTVHSPTRITAVAPPGRSGLVDVTVTNLAGTSPTSSTADDYTYAAPAITSVVVNGGPIAARDRFGKTLDLTNQSSVVTQLLVTFNQRVTLDAKAFQIVSHAGLTATGAPPSSANVAVIATGVESSGDTTLGYQQYVLTFAAGAGVNSFDYSESGGTAFTTLQDGSWRLETTGSKVHAGGGLPGADTAADHSNAFWSLFGVYAAGDIISSSDPTAMPESVRVDGLALSHVYAAFGSRNDATSQGYSPAFDSDLDGDVDGIDLGRLYLNFGAIWKF